MKLWRLIAKALGSKEGATNSEADKVALIRLFILLQAVITNMFIISGIIKHWND